MLSLRKFESSLYFSILLFIFRETKIDNDNEAKKAEVAIHDLQPHYSQGIIK